MCAFLRRQPISQKMPRTQNHELGWSLTKHIMAWHLSCLVLNGWMNSAGSWHAGVSYITLRWDIGMFNNGTSP